MMEAGTAWWVGCPQRPDQRVAGNGIQMDRRQDSITSIVLIVLLH